MHERCSSLDSVDEMLLYKDVISKNQKIVFGIVTDGSGVNKVNGRKGVPALSEAKDREPDLMRSKWPSSKVVDEVCGNEGEAREPKPESMYMCL